MAHLTLIAISISFFILAIFLGMLLISYVWQGKKPPRVVSITHGLFASIGLISLICLYVFYMRDLWLGVLLFVLTAFGGLYLFSHDLRQKKIPGLVATMHGSLALISFFVLIYLLMNMKSIL